MLATDMLLLAFREVYDTAVLVSCDADYAYAVEAVKNEKGRRVVLATVAGAKSYDLRTVCDDHLAIDDSMIARCLHP